MLARCVRLSSLSPATACRLPPVTATGAASRRRRRRRRWQRPGGDGSGRHAPAMHLDSTMYGAGCCCMQVTLQCRDEGTARYLYDQLATLAPILLALSAASAVFAGRLVDTDTRWNLLSQCLDDRTPVEHGEWLPANSATCTDTSPPADPTMAGGGVQRLRTSRWSNVCNFLHGCGRAGDWPAVLRCRTAGDSGSAGGGGADDPAAAAVARRRAAYNDVACDVDEGAHERLSAAGVDTALATHIAHLWTHDPLVPVVASASSAESDGDSDTAGGGGGGCDAFDAINSTVYHTVRLKPPPLPVPGAGAPESLGWRVELRPMEVRLTDADNAAFAAFAPLLAGAIEAFDLSLYVPLSAVDDNMERACARDGVSGVFHWRSRVVPPRCGSGEAGVLWAGSGARCTCADEGELQVARAARETLPATAWKPLS